MFFMNEDDVKAGFATPMRRSQRTWLKTEAARREIRIQDLVEEIIAEAQAKATEAMRQLGEQAGEILRKSS
jgi:hypothetical protein